MSDVKRIDPRRPFRITAEGLRRIVLGEQGHGQIGGSTDAKGGPQVKPRRVLQNADRWHMAIAHSDRGCLDSHSRQAIVAAAVLAKPDTQVVAVVLGPLEESLVDAGADRIVVLSQFDAARFDAELEVATVSALIAEYAPEHIFMADSAAGDGDLGRRLIALHGGTAVTHIVELSADHVAIRWDNGGRFARDALPRFLLLEPGVVDPGLPFNGAGERVENSSSIVDVRNACRDLGLEDINAANVALEEADFIVACGAGVRNVGTLETLARELGAAVGASRVAVDDGKFPRSKQIGATGKTVSAAAYVAVGISGAVQHLQGIKDCRHVIAINKDAGAPIVKRADLSLIGDAEEVMQAFLTRMSQARAQRPLPGEA